MNSKIKTWTEQEDKDLLYAWEASTLSLEAIAQKFQCKYTQIIKRLLELGAL